MNVGGYDLQLYCDARPNGDEPWQLHHVHRYDEFPHTFMQPTRQDAEREARKIGWIVARSPTGKDLCPKCSGKRPRKIYLREGV